MEIIEVGNQSTIRVFGVEFQGVRQLRKYALSGESKSGVYVGEDDLHYPCFDSEDFAYENRYYSNFVFARSRQELDRKLSLLKRVNGRTNYRKLNADTPASLLPMAYFEGDTCHPLEISVCQEVEVL